MRVIVLLVLVSCGKIERPEISETESRYCFDGITGCDTLRDYRYSLDTMRLDSNYEVREKYSNGILLKRELWKRFWYTSSGVELDTIVSENIIITYQDSVRFVIVGK